MLTETEYRQHAADRAAPEPHPICALVRQLRQTVGMSLVDFEAAHGIPAVVVGSYERGDRIPPLHKLETILGCFGYKLEAVPLDSSAIRLPGDLVTELRAIANQLEVSYAVPAVPEDTTQADGLQVPDFVHVPASEPAEDGMREVYLGVADL